MNEIKSMNLRKKKIIIKFLPCGRNIFFKSFKRKKLFEIAGFFPLIVTRTIVLSWSIGVTYKYSSPIIYISSIYQIIFGT